VVLKSGWKTEGRVIEAKDHVTVVLKSGRKVTYSRNDVDRVIRKDTPQQVFLKKFKAIDQNDLKALQDLATWSRLRGLGPEAVRVARRMLKIDPKSQFAKNILIRFKMVVEHIPPNKKREQELLAEFGRGFRVYRSRHYRICHNTDLDYAKERGKCFETLYEKFYRHFDKMGMATTFLKDRVEVVLFRSREQYAKYAGSKYPTLAMSAGFYSQLDNRASFFDGKGEAHYKTFQKQYSAYRRSLRNTRNQMSSLRRGTKITLNYGDGRQETFTRGGLRRKIREMEKSAKSQWKKFQSERQLANLSTTMHECTHQLTFNLGLLPMKGPVPKWLAEGIATFFEETKPERKGKASGVNKRMMKTYSSSQKPGLRDVLINDAVWMVFDQKTNVAYSQGWALFYFLSTQRQAQTVVYMKGMLKNAGRPQTVQSRIADFESAFGKIEDVEKEWRAFMGSAGQ